ncbi:MAG: PocR ligand-binding domain-containing protein, partial [Candidatus Thiodiazotropha sp.]
MNYRFTDLVDIEAFREMLKSFYEATGILHGLVDAENNVISAIGWQEACTDFHRVCPVSKGRCEESNRRLAEEAGTQDKTYVGGLCLNGLMDYASPIVIE